MSKQALQVVIGMVGLVVAFEIIVVIISTRKVPSEPEPTPEFFEFLRSAETAELTPAGRSFLEALKSGLDPDITEARFRACFWIGEPANKYAAELRSATRSSEGDFGELGFEFEEPHGKQAP